MIYVAQVEAGRVARVIVVPDDYTRAHDEVIVGAVNTVAIGWTYDGSGFAPPPELYEDTADV
ncbi:hypothetical protein [uncultured Paracoccus sp.]|uniref:hypothetical protein n=1 Tax=uncultured Paracoccus sp. TaxID=189685 RepID=UPI0025FAED24|nr:hypothetical protein [uncultured Paracoccus sp.]